MWLKLFLLHPILVHFTVALFSTSVGFYLLAYLASQLKIVTKFASELEIAARWCLWLAAFITIITISAGFYSYFTVEHDAASHEAMTTHRNWAVPASSFIFLVAIWSGWRYYKHRALTHIFIISLLIIEGLLLVTAWYGGELVYRYGLGVMTSLPQADKKVHHHINAAIENLSEKKSTTLHNNLNIVMQGGSK